MSNQANYRPPVGQFLAAPGGHLPYPAPGQFVTPLIPELVHNPFVAPTFVPNGQPYRPINFIQPGANINGFLPQWGIVNPPIPAPLPKPEIHSVELNPVLDAPVETQWKRKLRRETNIYYDIRDSPRRALLDTRPAREFANREDLRGPATYPYCTRLKIIIKNLPWEINVESENATTMITVEDVLQAVHDALHMNVTRPEWLILTDERRERIISQGRRNCEAAAHKLRKPRREQEGIKRIDWLLGEHIMRGLRKDDEFIAERIDDPAERERTWVLATGPKEV
ncbi:uncharacterized protein EI90DRAFT_3064833 [Cantharellus anzutake]|uniref:uncharacterized protein n=1 Tax=Cantharellus anzutake TaxID=1750568 RepID=UPI00190645E6|nr:uncharacterized protein EI90DRAFT_3064833 [Cantharellus anzutake]KAF8328614.1 hypothetical protein EI90DRAFT_3064833 [Cantharellus anzutake]